MEPVAAVADVGGAEVFRGREKVRIRTGSSAPSGISKGTLATSM
jgi:hypothetical protein